LTNVQKGFPEQGIGMPLDYTAPHTPVYARDPASKSILLDGALEGHVLVKNVNNTLPLKSPKLLSIFGYDAVAPLDMDIASPANFLAPFTYGYESQLNYNGFMDVGPAPAFGPNGTLICGGELFSSLNFTSSIGVSCTDIENRRKRRKRSSIHLGTL
jgi:beta-glucosidase